MRSQYWVLAVGRNCSFLFGVCFVSFFLAIKKSKDKHTISLFSLLVFFFGINRDIFTVHEPTEPMPQMRHILTAL